MRFQGPEAGFPQPGSVTLSHAREGRAQAKDPLAAGQRTIPPRRVQKPVVPGFFLQQRPWERRIDFQVPLDRRTVAKADFDVAGGLEIMVMLLTGTPANEVSGIARPTRDVSRPP